MRKVDIEEMIEDLTPSEVRPMVHLKTIYFTNDVFFRHGTEYEVLPMPETGEIVEDRGNSGNGVSKVNEMTVNNCLYVRGKLGPLFIHHVYLEER